jgi:hypothetical protein
LPPPSIWMTFSSSKLKLLEIAPSHLDTQWGFNDMTPVEAGDGFAYARIPIKELCMS